MYSRRGVNVHLICATRGEAGMVEAKHLEGYTSVAELREAELRCAAGILGLHGVHFLDWRDSGMPGSPDNDHPQALIRQPIEVVAEQIANHIRQLKPQVVITFDPIGGYKHPDHIHIHLATVRGFQLAGDPSFPSELPPYAPQRLYYSLFPKGMLKWAVRLMPLLGQDPRHFGRNKDIDILDLAQSGDFPIHTRINYHSVLKERDAAAACHSSQSAGGPTRGPMRWARQLVGTYDYYMRAFPEAPKGLKENDLFK